MYVQKRTYVHSLNHAQTCNTHRPTV